MDWEVLGEVKELARPMIYSMSVFTDWLKLKNKFIYTLFTFKRVSLLFMACFKQSSLLPRLSRSQMLHNN